MSSSIPVEVVELFLRYLLDDREVGSDNDFINALCVNSVWRDAGARLLWTDITLSTPSRCLRFSSMPLSTNFFLVKSLTVSFHPLEPGTDEDTRQVKLDGNRDTQDLWVALVTLKQVLPKLKNLQTFSLYVLRCNRSRRPAGFFLRRSDVYNLVESLPESVTSLEIDTKGYDFSPGGGASYHTCLAISKRLPSLTHIRIRLSRMCEQLFNHSANLRSFVVNMNLPSRTTETRECSDPHDHNQDDSSEQRQSIGAKTRQLLVDAAETCLGNLPQLSQMLIIDSESFMRSYGPLVVDSMKARDLISKRTKVYPMDRIREDWTPYKERLGRMGLRLFDGDSGSIDMVGNIADVEELVEGHAWYATTSGSRFPAAYRHSAQGRRHSWHPYTTCLPRAQLASDTVFGVDLWHHEAMARRLLIQPVEYDGVDEIKPLLRDSYGTGQEAFDSDDSLSSDDIEVHPAPVSKEHEADWDIWID